MKSRILLASTILALTVACSNSPTGGGDDDDDNATPTPTPAPAIDSISPQIGAVTTEVVISGHDLGASGTVTIGGGAATVTSWSDTEVVAEVGPDSYPGLRPVVVTPDGQTSAEGLDFRVILRPAIYVDNDQATNTVSTYTLEPSTGALTPLGNPVETGGTSSEFGGCGNMIAIHEATRRLFVTNTTSVSVFDIDPATGELSLVDGSPFSTGGDEAFGVVVSPAGDLIYVANFNSGDVSILEVAADGSLSAHPDSPVTAVPFVDIPLLTDDGKFLFVNSENGNFTGFTVEADGGLTELLDAPYDTDANSQVFGAALTPDSNYITLADFNFDKIWTYSIDRAQGFPAQTATSPHDATGPNGLAYTHDGSMLYYGTFAESNLGRFSVSDGELTPVGNVIDLTNDGVVGMSCMQITSDDQWLIILDEVGGDIHTYQLDGANDPAQLASSPVDGVDKVANFQYGMSGLVVTSY